MTSSVVKYAAFGLSEAVLLLLSWGLIKPLIEVVVRRGKTRSSVAPARSAGRDTWEA